MCVSTDILSSGRPVARAVTCMMAVTKAMGLNRPGSHSDSGSTRSADQRSSCSTRTSRSENQNCSDFFDAHASFSHDVLWKTLRPGT
jgi:hypothetical protein